MKATSNVQPKLELSEKFAANSLSSCKWDRPLKDQKVYLSRASWPGTGPGHVALLKKDTKKTHFYALKERTTLKYIHFTPV